MHISKVSYCQVSYDNDKGNWDSHIGFDEVDLAIEIELQDKQGYTITWEQIEAPGKDTSVTLLQCHTGLLYSSSEEHKKQIWDVTDTKYWKKVVNVPIAQFNFYSPQEYMFSRTDIFSEVEITFENKVTSVIVCAEYIEPSLYRFFDRIAVVFDDKLLKINNLGKYNKSLKVVCKYSINGESPQME